MLAFLLCLELSVRFVSLHGRQHYSSFDVFFEKTTSCVTIDHRSDFLMAENGGKCLPSLDLESSLGSFRAESKTVLCEAARNIGHNVHV